MMAEHQLIVVKEAQNIQGHRQLCPTTCRSRQMRTILVICYKNGYAQEQKE